MDSMTYLHSKQINKNNLMTPVNLKIKSKIKATAKLNYLNLITLKSNQICRPVKFKIYKKTPKISKGLKIWMKMKKINKRF